MRTQVLITASGTDKPGITATLMNILARSRAKISDMGQSVTQGLLSLSITLSLDESSSTPQTQLLKDLLFEAKSLDIEIDFQIVDEHIVNHVQVGDTYILNCVGTDDLKAEFIYDVSKALYDFNVNIERIDNLSARGFKSLEILALFPGKQDKIDILEVKRTLYLISHNYRVDIALIKDNVYRRNKRLICFDMDSTLIQTEVIDEMAQVMGVGKEVKSITKKAMDGEIDFNESLTKRVASLKGLTLKQMEEIAHSLPLTDGVEEFIDTVKSIGYKIAILSGGFSFFANYLKDKLELDYVFANKLEVKDKALTGRIIGEIVDGEKKAEHLIELAEKEGIVAEQVVAIGDGANDLMMLSKAGLGIAFQAKEIVRKKAETHINFGPMSNVLYFLGLQPQTNK